jgi:predicted neuraminidase
MAFRFKILSLAFVLCIPFTLLGKNTKQMLTANVISAKSTFLSIKHFKTVDTTSLKQIDSVIVDADYKIVLLADTKTLRFHFNIIKSDNTQFKSQTLTADFAISNGFIAMFDVKAAALLVIAKLKAGATQSALTANELKQNNINY